MDDSASASSSRSERPRLPTAKWGAACAACATAKAKCIRSDPTPGAKCDRCHRLYKECAGQVHKPRKKRQVKPSRTAQIEERLNGLVSILKASGELSQADLSAAQSLGISIDGLSCRRTSSRSRSSRDTTPASSSAFQPCTTDNPWAIPESYNSGAPQSCICRPETGDAPPPPDTDDALLDVYRTELLPLHPFVAVSPTITAAELKETRPFLMASIRMVASFRSVRSMRAQMYYLMKHISEHMLIRSERSLDMLMGIIVVLGWYQYHCFTHAQMANLVSLAVTLVGDLSLNRPSSGRDRMGYMVLGPAGPACRTTDGMRALAGAWFLSSTIAMGFGKTEPMKYTHYLQECIKELENKMEYETDLNLIYLVRIQHLNDRIFQLNTRNNPMGEVTTINAAPRSAYVPVFQAELDSIRDDMPDRLKYDRVGIFQAYLNTAALRLYEPPVASSPLVHSIAQSLTTSSYSGGASPLDELYQSKAAINTWFENWLAVPASSYHCQTTPTCCLIVYAVAMLGRWAKLVTPTLVNRSTSSSDNTPSADTSAAEAGSSVSPPWQAQKNHHHPHPFSLIPALSSTAATPSAGSDMSAEKEPCPYHPARAENDDEGQDAALPRAVASLHARLSTQPGLSIDIPYVLGALYSRFDAASSGLQERSTGGEHSDHNIWSMSAIKILITRAKLEQWAELVTEGMRSMTLGHPEGGPMGGGGNAQSMGGLGGVGIGGFPPGNMATTAGQHMNPLGYAAQQQQQQQQQQQLPQGFWTGADGGTPWMDNFMQDAGTPNNWFDGYMDWGNVMMDPMGQ